MANPWSIPAAGWAWLVAGWWLSPIITWLLQKLFAYLDFEAAKQLRDLEINTIPALKATIRVVEEKRVLGAGRVDASRSDLELLDKRDMDLKSALCQAEDILDLVDYHRIEKEVTAAGDSLGSSWDVMQLLHSAAGTFVACWCWTGSMIQRRCIDIITPSWLLQFVQGMKQKLGQLFGGISLLWSSGALLPVSQATSSVGFQRIRGWCRQLIAIITSCCRAMLSSCTHRIADAQYYRDWSYEQVGIKTNQQEYVNVPITERIRLSKQIKRIQDTLTSSKKSDLLNQNRSTAKDDDKENDSKCTVNNSTKDTSSKQKEIDALYRSIKKKVVGRDKHRDRIIMMLREGPGACAASSSSSIPYCVIGIYGITGSGKSTLAQHVCDYEKGAGHFNHIMFILVGKTFSIFEIFREMLEQIKQQRPSDTKDPNESQKKEFKDVTSLRAELQKELQDKCFLLVLDDLWVNTDNIMERRILLNLLNAGKSGSRILVTAQKKDAAAALGAQEKMQIPIPDLQEEEYLSMFMHYAVEDSQVNSIDNERYKAIGRKIVKKLGRSPIAAITVAARLKSNSSIDFWERTSNLDVLNETRGALWWSYQQLGDDIRRCFAYCSIFPKAYKLKRDELVRIWIAQGFVNTSSNTTEEPEDIGQSYFDELLTFSFLQVLRRPISADETVKFTIHDLLHDLAERVSGSEFLRIGLNKGSPREILSGARHLFIEIKNVAEVDEKILDLGNLRTLIIKEDPFAEGRKKIKRNHDFEKLLEGLFMRLTKLRVLIVKLNCYTDELSVPACVDQMKHLRYLRFDFRGGLYGLILPSSFSKLYHIQTIDIRCFKEASCPEDMASLIYLQHIYPRLSFPNIGRLTSLQTLEWFEVKELQGYGLNQLMDLNRLRGTLCLSGLDSVGSKQEALEVKLNDKDGLRKLRLAFTWDIRHDGPDVQAEVLEGLCPPKDLQELQIGYYKGTWYPSWMLSRHHANALKHLHKLVLVYCSQQLTSIPEDSGLFFIRLRELVIFRCDWKSLPENMECLVSLETLKIHCCNKMELLPTLPHQSLKQIIIFGCLVLSKTCKEEGHENWFKIQHIPVKRIGRWVPL